jgi:hypothetical protein
MQGDAGELIIRPSSNMGLDSSLLKCDSICSKC